MKKFFLLLFSAILFIACEGPMGPPGQDGLANWKIEDFEIHSSDWVGVYDDNGLFIRYEYIFDFPDLTEFVYNNGAYVTYLEVVESDDRGNKYKVQKPLPYTISLEDSQGLWEQRIDCDYSAGTIGFYVTNTDFREECPGTLLMRAVLMW